MIVWYKNKVGKPEFFVLYRKKGDCVILTGHVGDQIDIQNESDLDAAQRELKEELGIDAIDIIDLNTHIEVKIKDKLLSEHPYLMQIDTKNVRFLEANEKHRWISAEKIIDTLTYQSQRNSLKKVLRLLGQI